MFVIFYILHDSKLDEIFHSYSFYPRVRHRILFILFLFNFKQFSRNLKKSRFSKRGSKGHFFALAQFCRSSETFKALRKGIEIKDRSGRCIIMTYNVVTRHE